MVDYIYSFSIFALINPFENGVRASSKSEGLFFIYNQFVKKCIKLLLKDIICLNN